MCTSAGTYRIIRHHTELATLDWPTTEGTIIESRGLPCTRKAGRPGLIPHVRYAYKVDGIVHVGNRRTTDESNRCGNPDVILELLQAFPSGAKVTVAYDSDDPSSSYLQPGPAREAQVLYIMALMFATLGFIGMVLLAFFPDWITHALDVAPQAPADKP